MNKKFNNYQQIINLIFDLLKNIILILRTTKWPSLNSLKTKLISWDSKLNSKEEDKEKLITMPERD